MSVNSSLTEIVMGVYNRFSKRCMGNSKKKKKKYKDSQGNNFCGCEVKERCVQTRADRLLLTWGCIYPCSSLAQAPQCFDQKQKASSPRFTSCGIPTPNFLEKRKKKTCSVLIPPLPHPTYSTSMHRVKRYPFPKPSLCVGLAHIMTMQEFLLPSLVPLVEMHM